MLSDTCDDDSSDDGADESSLIKMVSDPRFDEDKALELLVQGVSIAGSTNIGDEDYYLGASILHGAYFSESKKKFFFQLLSHPEVDLNAVCDEGYQEETLHFDKSLSPGDNSERSYRDGYAVEEATVLHFAVLANDINAVRAILQTKRANIQALAKMVQNKHLWTEDGGDMVAQYSAGENVNQGRETLGLAWRCREAIPIIRISKVTPLHLAARSASCEMVSLLLASKADPYAKDSTGKIPLDYFQETIAEEPDKDFSDLTQLFSKMDIQKQKKRFHSRLMLGEADFSYTEALLKKHPDPLLARAITATEFCDQTSMSTIHGTAFNVRLESLKAKGVVVKFRVDATQMSADPDIKAMQPIDRIHFNFPHDKNSFKARTLPRMIHGFFREAKKLQEIGGKVHVALPKLSDRQKRYFYESYVYDIHSASAAAGYVLIKKRHFGSARYPGYQHVITNEGNSAAVAENSREYIFEKTNLNAEQINAHPSYRCGGMYSSYDQKFPYLHERDTDNDSSDYTSDRDNDVENSRQRKRGC